SRRREADQGYCLAGGIARRRSRTFLAARACRRCLAGEFQNGQQPAVLAVPPLSCRHFYCRVWGPRRRRDAGGTLALWREAQRFVFCFDPDAHFFCAAVLCDIIACGERLERAYFS